MVSSKPAPSTDEGSESFDSGDRAKLPPKIEQMLGTLMLPWRVRETATDIPIYYYSDYGYDTEVAVGAYKRLQSAFQQACERDSVQELILKLLNCSETEGLNIESSSSARLTSIGFSMLVAAECELGSELASTLIGSACSLMCDTEEAEACRELIKSEIEVLASIYPSDDADPLLATHSLVGCGNSKIASLVSLKINLAELPSYLDCYILEPSIFGDFTYPNSGCVIPFLRLATTASYFRSQLRLSSVLSEVRRQLWARALELKGSCAIYQLRCDAEEIIRSVIASSQGAPPLTVAAEVADDSSVALEMPIINTNALIPVRVHSSRNGIDRSLVEGHPFWHRSIVRPRPGRGARGGKPLASPPSSSGAYSVPLAPKEMIDVRRTLPAWQSRGPFVDMIDSTKVNE